MTNLSLNKEANIFIKNLADSVTSRVLSQLLEQQGEILSCFVRYSDDNKPLGYGYCQFSKVEEADKCIQEMNGKMVAAKQITVTKFIPRGKRAGFKQKNNLYISNFPVPWDNGRISEFIKETFEGYGKITSSAINESKKKPGVFTAFVCYEKEEDASKAFSEMNGSDIDDSTLYVNFVETKENLAKKKSNIIIFSIRPEVTEEQVKSVFETYGSITSIKLKEQKINEKQLQQCFINFRDSASATEVITKGKENSSIRELISDQDIPKNGTFITFWMSKSQKESMDRTRKTHKGGSNQKGTSQQLENMLRNMAPHQRNAMLAQMKAFSSNLQGRGNGNPTTPFPKTPMMGMNPIAMQQNPMMMQQNPMMMQHNMGMMQQNMGMMGMPYNNMGGMGNMGNMGNMGGMGNMGMPMMGNSRMMNNPNINQQLFGANSKNMPPQQSPLPKNPDHYSVEWIINHVEEFKALENKVQKNSLGTHLFPLINTIITKTHGSSAKDLTPRVTGMLIDLDVLTVEDIIEYLTKNDILELRTREAIDLIISEENEEGNENEQ